VITGITGQDGAYLARLLLSKGYRVIGAARNSSNLDRWRLRELGIDDRIEIAEADLLEDVSVSRLISEVRPDEFYNLAAQSSVSKSFQQPIMTSQITAEAVTRMLESIRIWSPHTRFYQASSSELFGNGTSEPRNEDTPFRPRSPYAISKLYAHWMVINYREAYGLNSCCGLLFNHESPLRGAQFVTRKITNGLAMVKLGLLDHVTLGNVDIQRDWGFAGDYVVGMWMMLQRDIPDEFVLATGRARSIKDFCDSAARALDLDLAWQGQGVDAKAVDRRTNRTVVAVDPGLYRPTDLACMVGDPAKAQRELGWQVSMDFDELVATMARSDWDRLSGVRRAVQPDRPAPHPRQLVN
jgi:GDPmannose 4,6-dehydratase